MINKGMLNPQTGRFVSRITGLKLNNGARRREAKRIAKEAEYERNWSLTAEDRRRKSTVDERAAVHANNQRIFDGMDTSYRRKNGVSLPPRHIRRRPLQEAWKKRNSA